MEGLNKAISFILGLVVVVVFIAVLTGRINLSSRLSFLGKVVKTTATKTNLTPTPSGQKISTIIISPPQTKSTNNYYNVKVKTNGTIPSTGPTMFFPLLTTSLLIGSYLRKQGKKD
ncbi:MAG: hypothetical protein QHH09_00720 [Microgenomates group bacterium]|nr:hypothetical protein [Microgenomates group bacterium]